MKKVCTKCGIEKPLDEFYNDKSSKDGKAFSCKVCKREQVKAYRQANKDKIAEYRKAHYQANRDRILEYNKAYQQTYYEANKQKKKAYQQANKERILKRKKAYHHNRIKTDPLYKLKYNLRTRTNKAFKRGGYRKDTKTQEMLGVDWEVAFAHIERQFKKGMSWDNYGEWHIDHIIPLSTANTEEEMKKLCHYSNLQPLWGKDNLSKKDNIEHGTQSKLRI